jgi:hypothetical protein
MPKFGNGKINCINFSELGEHDTKNEIFFLKRELMLLMPE